MSISNINSYTNNAVMQWQNQQLKGTGNGSSKNASSLGNLFTGAESLTSQLSSMVELTKYAMNSMGLSSDSRVTFSQITRYREQLQEQFSESLKKGLSQAGVKEPESLTFSVNKEGVITVNTGNAADKKAVQTYIDANPSFGTDLRKSLTTAGISAETNVTMRIGVGGSLNVVNNLNDTLQGALNADKSLADNLRTALKDLNLDLTKGLNFKLDEEGKPVVDSEHPNAAEINAKLATADPEMLKKLKETLEKNKAELSNTTFTLNKEGALQINVNNAELNDIQKVLNTRNDIGKSINTGLSGLGVNPNTDFSIQTNDDGSVTIISASPERDKIQKFFDENPTLVKKYRQIEALSGIDDARKAMQLSPTEMRKRIQIESMASWWAGSGSASSYFGNMSGGNLSMMAGLNMNV